MAESKYIYAQMTWPEIGRVAAAEGMKSLREDGIDKVLLGMTSVEEIARVIV